MPITTSYRVTGVQQLYRRINGVSGAQLKRKTANSFLKSGTRILVPVIQSKTPHKYGGHQGRYPTKGLLGKRQKITARQVRLRSGEIAAVSVKPRVWVEHFVVKGTRAHFIGAKYATALYFGGMFSPGVHHPGSQPNDYINAAAQGHEQEVLDALSHDLFDLIGV